MARNIAAVLALAALAAAGLAGCTDDEEIRLAFLLAPDEDVASAEDPQRLADWVAAETGEATTIYGVASTSAILSALFAGQADAAFLDGAAAWWGWQRFGLDVIASETRSDGRAFYLAAAWVKDNETFTDMTSLEGARSCHTGLYKSAGMFMPLGWLIGQGLVEPTGDELSDIQPTVLSYFSDASFGGGIYGDYQGALRCLSEDAGDVAFVRDTTPEDFCGGGEAPAWCLDVDDYHMIQAFGQVPEHAVVIDPEMPADRRTALLDALLALNDSPDGQDILGGVLQTGALVETTAQAHLGEYGDNLRHVPGIDAFIEDEIEGGA